MEDIPPSASGKLAQLKNKDAIEAEEKRIDEKRAKAASIVFRHIVEKKDLATAYSEVFPESTATRRQKKKQAGRLIKWFRLNFPIAIRQLLYLKGYDDDRLVDEVGLQLQATLPNRVIKTRKLGDGTIERVEEWVVGSAPDHKTRADALQKLITLAGHHARRGHVPSADEAAATEPRSVNEPRPMKINTVKKVPPGEWQQRYQRHLEESNASNKADEMLRDLERRVAEAEAANGEVTHRRRRASPPPRPLGSM